MGCLNPPKPLNLDSGSNFAEVWKVRKDNFTIFLQATESSAKSDLIKSSILLLCIGQPAKDVYKTFTFAEGDEMKYNEIIRNFDAYFKPRTNLTFLCFTFLTARVKEKNLPNFTLDSVN